MLVIIMHNNSEYMDYLCELARKEDIRDYTVISQEGIGSRLLGGDASFVLLRGQKVDAYSRAFIASVGGGRKTKTFMDAVEQDDFLDRINADDKGFMCAIPFHYIVDLEFKARSKRAQDENTPAGLFKEEWISLDIKASDKESVIKELAHLLKGATEVVDFEQFIKDVFEREALNATGIGGGIAIPHARTDAVRSSFVVMGRSSRGIDFGAADRKPARLIFLIGAPRRQENTEYIQILARLSRLLRQESFRQTLLNASRASDIIAAFEKSAA